MTTPTDPSTSRASASDARLLRAVGVWGLAAGIINVTIGGGIFRLPGSVYKDLGPASPIAYLICAVVMVLIVVCFAEAGSRVSLTGGLYAYVEVAFGPLVGFVTGVMLWAGMTTAMSAVAVFFGDAVAALIPALSSPGAKIFVITAVLAAFAALNVAGVGNASRFNSVMTVAKLLPLALVIVVGLVMIQPERLSIPAMPSAETFSRGSIVLIFAFLGIESALVPSGEVRDPSRTVPRAIGIAMALIVVIYLCIHVATQSALGPALANSATPVADAAGALMGGWGRMLILVGSTVSMFGYVSGMTLAVPRMLYAFGRDGFLPSVMASVHERFRTPHVAIAVQAVVSIILATTGTFEALALISNGSILLVYAACALAVIQLRRRDVRSGGEPFVAPLGGLVPILALLAILWLLSGLKLEEWLALVGVSVVAGIIFLATRGRRTVTA